MMCSLAPVLRAADGCNQRLSPAEFRARQKAYITEKAGLTKEEAARFFPLYFELQDKKKSRMTRRGVWFVRERTKRPPKPNMMWLWKACTMPVSLPTVWTRLILRSSRRYCLPRNFIWCRKPRCVFTGNCWKGCGIMTTKIRRRNPSRARNEKGYMSGLKIVRVRQN